MIRSRIGLGSWRVSSQHGRTRFRRRHCRTHQRGHIGSGRKDQMIAIIRFIIVPGVIILDAAWWLILRHRRSTLLPFLIIVAVVMFTLRLAGLSPLGFFVSYGGAVWFCLFVGGAGGGVGGNPGPLALVKKT